MLKNVMHWNAFNVLMLSIAVHCVSTKNIPDFVYIVFLLSSSTIRPFFFCPTSTVSMQIYTILSPFFYNIIYFLNSVKYNKSTFLEMLV